VVKPEPLSLAQQVREANRTFYDAIAADYERVDGRRNARFLAWLAARLRALRAETPGGRLLDLGCGSGVVLHCARESFDLTVGLDLSASILQACRGKGDGLVCGDVGELPFRDASFDAVACFATLHHVLEHGPLLREVHRVLRPGGVLYTDHDLSLAFARRHAWPLALYRAVFSAARRYRRADRRITSELYHLTEIHEGGVDDQALLLAADQAGFSSVGCRRHWYGLNRLLDACMGPGEYALGRAPLVSLLARK
jgi:ubiquinone/menaquinone biosynthesis C-methylase UbiE